MYMAIIYGWQTVTAFSENKEKAKRLAVNAKKASCRDDLTRWTWASCAEYYGARVTEIREGDIITD